MHLRHDHSAPSLPPNLRANPPSVTPSLLCVEEKKQPGISVSSISFSGISGPRRRNEALWASDRHSAADSSKRYSAHTHAWAAYVRIRAPTSLCLNPNQTLRSLSLCVIYPLSHALSCLLPSVDFVCIYDTATLSPSLSASLSLPPSLPHTHTHTGIYLSNQWHSSLRTHKITKKLKNHHTHSWAPPQRRGLILSSLPSSARPQSASWHSESSTPLNKKGFRV